MPSQSAGAASLALASIIRHKASSDVGSIQCRSSKIISTGSGGAESLEVMDQRAERPLLHLLWRQLWQRIALTTGNRQESGEQRHVAREVLARRREQAFELVAA